MGKKHGQLLGIESRIESHPALEAIGAFYESCRRTALSWLQQGLSEIEVEKKLQKEKGLQWAWADSIATEASQTYDQLLTASQNQIADLKTRIQAKTRKATKVLKDLEKRLKKPFQTIQNKDKFKNNLLGLKSKILKISSLKRDLVKLENTRKIKICFGSRKLFKAQHHLEENGYSSREEWLEDWQKKRSGRFYCVGKSTGGGGTMIKVLPLDDEGLYKILIQIPRPLQNEHGKCLEIVFKLNDGDTRNRKSNLDYAISSQKPITTQCFRREEKDNQWYVHLTTYVQEIPIVHCKKRGCLGLDFNKDSISATYVKPDGNIGSCIEFSFKWQGLTTGQRQARMRDIVADIVKVAETRECAIAIESLDFSKKKASMSEESKLYNEMLSNLSTALFRSSLESRCKRSGVELIKVNPAFTSIIGMIKFMSRYGLNSGTSAAMAIARRALNLSERLPKCLSLPEDKGKHSWSAWNRVARYIKLHRIRRTQLFQWMKALEGISIREHLPSMPVDIEMGEVIKSSPVTDGSSVQVCLGF